MKYLAQEVFKAADVFANDMMAIKRISDICDEKLHEHDFVEIVYILDGKGKHYINGVEYPVQKGNLLYINYGCTHSFKVDERLVAYNLMYKPDYFSKELINENNLFNILMLTSFEDIQQELDKSGPLVAYSGREREDIQYIFDKLEYELRHDFLGQDTVLNAYSNILMTSIFRKVFGYDETDNEIIPRSIVDYICAHCEEKLALKDLSEQCFYNPSYFSRLFKKAYQMTLTDFIVEQRLKKSCGMMKDAGLSLEEIAERCGFADKTTFYNRFKQKYGCTPGEWRRNHKE